jgi:trimeric autotransporter adhesin
VWKIVIATGVESVFAGVPGLNTNAGDGGLAVNAKLNGPTDIVFDSSGNAYICDAGNNRIRKVDTSGNISTWVGTGTASSTGDGGAGTAATINSPQALAMDASNNLFIAEFSGNKIRKVTSGGTISLYAGTGTASSTGDGAAATLATLNNPRGLAVDSSGNVFVGEYAGARVRKITAATGIITTYAGDGTVVTDGDGGSALTASFKNVGNLTFDSSGNLYVAEYNAGRIRKVTTGNVISTVAGQGVSNELNDGSGADTAFISTVRAAAFDTSGNMYVADYGNFRVRKVAVTTSIITTFAGTGLSPTYNSDRVAATTSRLYNPAGMDIDASGNIYLADYNNCRIRKITPQGSIYTVVGTGSCGSAGDGGSALLATINGPKSVVFDSAGNYYISEYTGNRVRKVDTSGNISTVAGTGTAGFNSDGVAATTAQVNQPEQLAVDSSNNLYIADEGNHRIRKITVSTGIISTVAGNGTSGSAGDGAAATSANLKNARGIAVDSAGDLFIGDTGNHKIRKVDTGGIITTYAGNGTAGLLGDGGAATSAEFNTPWDVALDATGNLYVADQVNHRIRQIDTSGNISTFAGSSMGYSGDGGVATSATLQYPIGVAVDSLGNVLIGDYGNFAVREVTRPTDSLTSPTISLSAPYSSHAGTSYTWSAITATTMTLSKVTFTVPSGTAGTPTLGTVSGLPGGGTIALAGTTVTYTLASSTTVAANTTISLVANALTNTITSGNYTSVISTFDTQLPAMTVDTGTTPSFNIAPESTTQTQSATTITIVIDPNVNSDITANQVLTIVTNAKNGYTLTASATALSGVKGTIAAVSTGTAVGVASGSFPADKWGYTVAIGGNGSGVAQGQLPGGNYVGYTTGGQSAVVAAGPALTGDTVTVTNRVKVDYLTPASSYTSTLTFKTTPSY